jgi:predicted DNA-binding protein with PD1-like motif
MIPSVSMDRRLSVNISFDGEMAVAAGHVKEAHISYTGEVMLSVAPFSIGRRFDESAGIEVWALS